VSSGAPTWRIFRALAWLRWRMVVNAVTRSGARDILERLSRTAESLLPVAIVVLLVPSGIALLTAGWWTGAHLSSDEPAARVSLEVVRWLLAASLVLTVAGPALLSAGQQASGMVRLLLLPIPAGVLYASHAVVGLTEPWVFLAIPLLIGMAGGGASTGAFMMGGALLLAGMAFVLVLLGIAALSNAALLLLVRNRRRAELLVLLGMLLVVLVSILPSALIPDDGERGRRRRPSAAATVPRWVQAIGAAIPSELYISVAREAPSGNSATALTGTAALLAWAVATHGLTWPLYQGLLRTPSSNGGVRRISRRGRVRVLLPGIGPRTSAVAVSYVKLAMRTPRGRTIVLMPLLMVAVFAVLFYVRGSTLPMGPVRIGAGYSLGVFGIVLALMSIVPFAFNQFAVDRAGLTLEFLSPISTRELLYGKAIGGAVLAAIPCALSVAAGAATGGHSVWLWLAVTFGALSAYILLSPVAAVLSLMFPRTVDLSSIGQASNAHQAAGLLGLLGFAIVCAPAVALSLIGLRVLHSPVAAAGLLALWVAASTGLAYLGFLIAERLMDERRENLALVASGR
jgi:hypothetical protein